jgi:hypothetical protein
MWMVHEAEIASRGASAEAKSGVAWIGVVRRSGRSYFSFSTLRARFEISGFGA